MAHADAQHRSACVGTGVRVASITVWLLNVAHGSLVFFGRGHLLHTCCFPADHWPEAVASRDHVWFEHLVRISTDGGPRAQAWRSDAVESDILRHWRLMPHPKASLSGP